MADSSASPRFALSASCPVCLGTRLRFARKGTLSAADLSATKLKSTYGTYGETWDLSECLDCGHLFANPIPDRADLVSLYARVEDTDYEGESSGRSRNFLRILKRLERYAPAKGSLFDAGAASGLFLSLARRRHWLVTGVEPGAWLVEYAKNKYGLALRHGAFEEIPASTGPYQAVSMIDLIEHMAAPRLAVAKAYDLLAPGGVLCLVTPDIHSLAARLAGQRWWHLRPGHIAFFSAKSLTRLLQDAGFTILRRTRYAWTFSLHYIFARIPALAPVAARPKAASFLKRFQIKLALRDSFEFYAMKEPRE
jgi:2-polyprenyl-3-methyl-5-hydroxy-6-metoxy-1,4-benzoquinol methylase